MNVEEWEARLDEHFPHAHVNERILPIFEAEREYGIAVTTFLHGHQKLSDCFQTFFLDTLTQAEASWDRGAGGGGTWYGRYLLAYACAFRSIRACETLYTRGHPLAGYTLLRDLKDQSFVLAAVGRGETTYRKASGLEGVDDGTLSETDFDRIRWKRINEEKRIRKNTTGSTSGLAEEISHELEEWQKGFDLEMHGSRFTASFEAKRWIEDQGELPLQPEPPTKEALGMKMYANRAEEIGWMLLRTLPLLQLAPGAFGNEWATRWLALDDSFRVSLQGLADQGKVVFSAVIRLVDEKFSFAPDESAYPNPEDP